MATPERDAQCLQAFHVVQRLHPAAVVSALPGCKCRVDRGIMALMHDLTSLRFMAITIALAPLPLLGCSGAQATTGAGGAASGAGTASTSSSASSGQGGSVTVDACTVAFEGYGVQTKGGDGGE